MIKVRFYDKIDDSLLKFAVIVSKYNNQWVFCKHRDRDTYEVPGGHREQSECIDDTARRELYEETGAVDYEIKPVCIYSVSDSDNPYTNETFGMLYYAEIFKFDELPPFEIERIEIFDTLPTEWTYPQIQPMLVEKIIEF